MFQNLESFFIFFTPANLASSLQMELQKEDLSDLYSIFLEHGNTVNTVWLLDEDDLIEMGLSIGERKRYLLVANKKKKVYQDSGNSEFFNYSRLQSFAL